MPASPPCETAAQIDELAKLPLESLRERWTQIFGTPAPVAARSDYLVRAIAFHLQVKVEGGIALSAARRLQKRLRGLSVDAGAAVNRPGKLRPGTRLLREWQGDTHEVTVLESGYCHLGVTYQSLSEIARLITGARWSGPLFFGLKGNVAKSAKRDGVSSRPTYVVDLGSKSRARPSGVKGSVLGAEVGHGR